MDLRSFVVAFLALAMSLGLPLGAAAFELEIVVNENITIFRCTSAADLNARTNDCSDSQATWDCKGEIVAVERNELGGCNTRVATGIESVTLVTQQEELVDIVLASLDSLEIPLGGPEDEVEELLDPNALQSTEPIQSQVQEISTGVTTAPTF